MTFMPDKHHRRSIRLPGYDYAQAGAYFVTIYVQNRECLFGEVIDGAMQLNDAGRVVAEEWVKTAEIRTEIELDEFVVMPNHFHAIVWIVGDPVMGDHAGDRPVAPTGIVGGNGHKPRSVAAVMAGFKSAVTKRINASRGTAGASVWQRNYYEHIIRDEKSLNRIREYIANNPRQWTLDRENSVNVGATGRSPM